MPKRRGMEERRRRVAAPYPASASGEPPDSPHYRNMEHGILALLSFLGHSFKQGKISDESYYEAANASLRKLKQIRQQSEEAAYADASEEEPELKVEKLEKNRQDLEAMLSFLEESYNEGSISEESYRELKQENSKRLQRVLKLLGPYEGEETDLDAGLELPRKKTMNALDLESEEYDSEEPTPRFSKPLRPAAPEAKPPSRLKPSDTLSLYADLNESFDESAILDETEQIMRELHVKKKNGKGSAEEEVGPSARAGLDSHVRAELEKQKKEYAERKPSEDASVFSEEREAYGKEAEAYRKNVLQAEGAAAPPASASPSSEKKDPVASILGKLQSIVKQQSAQASGAAGGAAEGVEGPGGMKMYGSGTAEDPYRSTPEVQAPATTAPATEEKSLSEQLGGEDAGAGSVASGKIVLELEKLKVKVDGLSEMRNSLEERLGHIMESVGELRQMLFERDAATKEQDAKVTRFIDMVQDLDPQQILKELEKRDRQLGEFSMRMEKQETMGQDLAQRVNSVKELLESIGSLKNIAEVNKDIAEKAARVDRTVGKADRLGEEIGRVFVDLNRRLEEFNMYRGKQDLLAESMKDLVQLVESNNAKMNELATKSDVTDLKKAGDDWQLKLQELEAKQMLSEQGRDLPHALKELKKQKESIELVLLTNEEEFLEKAISKPDYDRVKQANLKKLAELEKEMQSEFSKIAGGRKSEDVKETQIVQSLEEAAEEAISEPAEDKEGPISEEESMEASASPASPSEAASVASLSATISPTLATALQQQKKAMAPAVVKTVAEKGGEEGGNASGTTGAPMTFSEKELVGKGESASLSEQELDALQRQLEEQAREQVQKVAEDRRKQVGGLLKKTIGSLFSTLRSKEAVLSSKPLRLTKKGEEVSAPPTPSPKTSPVSASTPSLQPLPSSPQTTSSVLASTPSPPAVPETKAPTLQQSKETQEQPSVSPTLVPGTATSASPPSKERPFVTWRDKRKLAGASQKTQEQKTMAQQLQTSSSAMAASPMATAEPPTSDQVLEARLAALKALREQYLAKEELNQKKAERNVIHHVKILAHSRLQTPARFKNEKMRPQPSKAGRAFANPVHAQKKGVSRPSPKKKRR